MPRKKANARTLTEVIDAALVIVDQSGLDGLTLRGISASCGVPTMTLYAYFQSKEQLLDLMSVEVASRLLNVAERSTWQGALEALCHHVRATALAHPSWLPLVWRLELPQSAAVRDHILALMTRARIPERLAARSILEATSLSLGLAQLELSLGRPYGSTARLQGSSSASAMDWDGSFASAIGRWIRGLESETQRDSDSTTSPPSPDSRSQVSVERVATMAVIKPGRPETSTPFVSPDNGSARMPPG